MTDTVAETHSHTAASKHVKTKSPAQKLYEIFTPRERIQAALLFLGSLLTALTQAVGVAVIFPFINVAMNPAVIQENRWLAEIFRRGEFSDTNAFILFLGCVVFAVIVISSLVPAVVYWGKTRFSLNKNHALSTRLLTVYLARPYQYFLGKNSSELGKNVLSEVGNLTMGMLMAVFELLIQSILLIVLVGMLLIVNVRITLSAMLLLGGGYAVLNLAIKKKLKKSGAESLKANEARYRFASEALGGIKTNRIMGIEHHFIQNYSLHSLNAAKHSLFAGMAGELPRYLMESLAFGGIVFFLVFRLAAGNPVSEIIPLISLYAFATYRIMPALHRIYYSVGQIHYFQALLAKIHTDLVEGAEATEVPLDEIASPRREADSLRFTDAIRLRGIDFRYADSEADVIRGLDIDIPKNASVGFVGATGSGKTTLVDIILGLLAPQSGKMLVDKTPVTGENVRAWRNMIGYVPQEIYLSDDTIRKNIAFGIPETQIDDEQVREAARIAALDEFIQTLPDKYNTFIGERGVRLSGGQRQRIGLARAVYRNPEILVLDEATSSLDGATEAVVLNAVRNASKARTVIMIAHRLNTLKDCDTIHVMENGRFTASGTYEELLRSNRTFMSMAKVNSLHDTNEKQLQERGETA